MAVLPHLHLQRLYVVAVVAVAVAQVPTNLACRPFLPMPLQKPRNHWCQTL